MALLRIYTPHQGIFEVSGTADDITSTVKEITQAIANEQNYAVVLPINYKNVIFPRQLLQLCVFEITPGD